uniref:Ribosomal protein L35Ae n=6 Tax=Triticinae TaxID=1648030 RepID=A0A453PTX3_AEGTS
PPQLRSLPQKRITAVHTNPHQQIATIHFHTEGYITHHERSPLGFLLPSWLRSSPRTPSSPPRRRRSSKMVKGRTGQRVRLYVRGTILGYKRSKSNQYETASLVQIEGVNTREDVAWYGGKRMAYVYKAKTKSNGTHYRCIWGKVSRPHGNTGVVRAKFTSNLPAEAMGKKVRVFMYPSSI